MSVAINFETIRDFYAQIEKFDFTNLVAICKDVPIGTYDEQAIIRKLIINVMSRHSISLNEAVVVAAEVVCTAAALSVFGPTTGKVRQNGGTEANALLDKIEPYIGLINKASNKVHRREALTIPRAAGMAAHIPLTIHAKRDPNPQFSIPGMKLFETHSKILKPMLPGVLGDRMGPKGRALCLIVAGAWSAIFTPSASSPDDLTGLIKRTTAATFMQMKRTHSTGELDELIKKALADWTWDAVQGNEDIWYVEYGVNRIKAATEEVTA